jgi:PEGA domain
MRRTAGVATMLVVWVSSHGALAQPAPENATEHGREAFQRGVELSRAEQWSDALAAFREAATARDHPRVEYNIAYCERALGHYAASIGALRVALREPEQLGAAEVEIAKDLLRVSERMVVRLSVTLEPAAATLAIDGQPVVPDADPGTFRVSVDEPGASRPLGLSSFALVLDPGSHVFHASRPGHEDVDVERSFAPGARDALDLRLDLLPATVLIRSEPDLALVLLDGREVGLAPVEIQRPAGTYRLQVARDQFDRYAATLLLQPGQRIALTAKLNPERDTIVRTWWFWTGVAAVVAGGAILTYTLTRPTPQPPPYQVGSANWLVHAENLTW